MRHFVRVFELGGLLGLSVIAGVAHAEEPSPPSAAFPIESPPSASPSGPTPGDEPRQAQPSPIPNETRREPEPAPLPPTATTPPAAPAPSAPAPSAPAPILPVPVVSTSDPDAVFRAFSRYADTQRRLRIGTAVAGVVAGAVTIGMGVAFADYFDFPPEPFYLLGGIAVVAPLVGLFSSSSAESYARQVGAHEPGHTEVESLALRRSWQNFAMEARSRRHWAAGGSFVVSGLTLGFGIAILEGAFSMPDNDRVLWGSVLMGAAGGMAASGASSLLVLSPVEAAYEQFEATVPLKKTPTVSLKAGPFGSELRLTMKF